MSAPIDIQNLLDHQVVEVGTDGSLPTQQNIEAGGWAAGSWAGPVRVASWQTTSPNSGVTRENGQYKIRTGTVGGWNGAMLETWYQGSTPQPGDCRGSKGSIFISDCVIKTPATGGPTEDGWNGYFGFNGGPNRNSGIVLGAEYPVSTWQFMSGIGARYPTTVPVLANTTYRITIAVYGTGHVEAYLDGQLVYSGLYPHPDELLWGSWTFFNSDVYSSQFEWFLEYAKVYAIVPPPTFTVAQAAEIIPGTATTRTDHKDT